MKKQIFYLATVALATGLAACSSDELENASDSLNLGKNDLVAAIPDAVGTRVKMDGNYAKWDRATGENPTQTEKIGVYYDNGNGNYEFTLKNTSTDSPSKGVFTYTGKETLPTDAKPEYAYYPYDESAEKSISDDQINIDLPQSRQWTKDIVKMPMVGKIDGSTIKFSNTTALVKITVINMPASKTYAKLTNLGNSPLYGAGSVDVSAASPKLVIDNSELSDAEGGYKSIKYYAGDTFSKSATTSFTEGETVDFYFIVPAGNYRGKLQFTLGGVATQTENTNYSATVGNEFDDASREATDNNTQSYTASLNAVAGTIYEHTLRYEKISEGKYALQDTEISGLNDKLEDGETDLSADLSSSAGTIYIPDGTEDITLTLKLGASKAITIQETNDAANRDVTVKLASDCASTNSSLTINLPNSNVTLVADGVYTKSTTSPAVTIAAVKASVKDLLHISEGVTLTALTMKAGNAYIEEGASATNSSSETCYFFNADKNVTSEKTENNVTTAPLTLYNLMYASGTTDVELTGALNPLQAITINEGVTVNLDLKGKKITAKTGLSAFIVNGTLNISDSGDGETETVGSIESTQTAAAIAVGATGTVKLAGGNVKNSNAAGAVNVAGTFNQVGGTLEGATSGNTAIVVVDGGTATINVPVTNVPAEGSTPASTKETLAVTGNVTVAGGGTFNLQSGEVKGTVTGTGEDKKTVTVAISGGKLDGASASALTLTSTAGTVEATISGGEVTSAATATVALTGAAGKTLKLNVTGGKIASIGTNATDAAISETTGPATIDIQGGEITSTTGIAISLTQGSLTVEGTKEVKVEGAANAIKVVPAAASNTVVLDLKSAAASYKAPKAGKVLEITTYDANSASITAGTFVGDIEATNKHFIAGGKFQDCAIMMSSDLWAPYIANGKKVSYSDNYYNVVDAD
jgi:hypothetical protein